MHEATCGPESLVGLDRIEILDIVAAFQRRSCQGRQTQNGVDRKR